MFKQYEFMKNKVYITIITKSWPKKFVMGWLHFTLVDDLHSLLGL